MPLRFSPVGAGFLEPAERRYEIDPASTAYYEVRCSSQEVRDLIQFYRLSKRPIGIDSFFRLPWILPPRLEDSIRKPSS